MKPLLDQAFWSDPEIEASKSGVKLAALWLITNSRTSLLGICGASSKRFEFETGLPEEALTNAVKALPGSFQQFGDVVFVRNYVRHQFGNGSKLTKNNFFVALKSLFIAIKDTALRDAILSEYPEFAEEPASIDKSKRDHTCASGLRMQIFERDGFQCLFTGEVLPASELEADHVIPVSKGGKTIPENLMCVSTILNTRKNNNDLESFCKAEGFDFDRIYETIKQRASKPLPGFKKPKDGEDRKGKDKRESAEREVFRQPTREEAVNYGREIGMVQADVLSWYDHFDSNGWKVGGKAKMKDWQAALRNGQRNASKNGNGKTETAEPVEPNGWTEFAKTAGYSGQFKHAPEYIKLDFAKARKRAAA